MKISWYLMEDNTDMNDMTDMTWHCISQDHDMMNAVGKTEDDWYMSSIYTYVYYVF